MEDDKYDILHQRIDIINTQLDAIMDTIQQMAKVIQLLQPVEIDGNDSNPQFGYNDEDELAKRVVDEVPKLPAL